MSGAGMDIELRLLRSFVTMHEAGSTARAADRMACTQAAMSMRLKMLETGIGVPLFRRGPQGLEPTPRGAELHAKAPGVLAAHDKMATPTRCRPGAARVRLAVPDACAPGWLGGVRAAVNLDRAEVGSTSDLSAHLMAGVQRQDVEMALLTPDSRRSAQARAEAGMALA